MSRYNKQCGSCSYSEYYKSYGYDEKFFVPIMEDTIGQMTHVITTEVAL